MSKQSDVSSVGFDLENFPIPDEGQPLEVYADAILNLRPKANFFGRSLGRVSWLQGKVLQRARKACPRGQWQKFLHLLGDKPNGKKVMTPETARLLMKVAHKVSEENSLKLEYVEMLRMVYPSFKQTMAEDAATDCDQKDDTDNNQGNDTASRAISFKQFRNRITKLLRKTQAMTKTGIQLPDDERAVEDLRRIVETMFADVLGALSMSAQRKAA